MQSPAGDDLALPGDRTFQGLQRARAPAWQHAAAATQADIDSAYRRVPVAPAHRWTTAITFQCNGETYVSTHYALPFGGTASVHGWHRIGDMIAVIGRRIVKVQVRQRMDAPAGGLRGAVARIAIL